MFKILKQLGSVLLLGAMLLSINSYVFAASTTPAKSKDECLTNLKNESTNLKNKPTNFTKCTNLDDEAKTCLTDSTGNFIEICKNRFKSFHDECSTKYSSQKGACIDEVEKYEQQCLDDFKNNPDNTAGCKAKKNAAIKCTEDVNKAIDEICAELFPFDEGIPDPTTPATATNSESETESTTKAPTIPKIDTLVRPNVEDVSKVSPYLSGTFLPRVAKTIVSFGIGAAVIGLILGSIGMLTAYGNDEKYGNAKKAIYFSIIGLVICILAFAIVQLIFYTGFQAGQIK